jgi:peptide-methionine (R)-S-oxide reductase
MTRRTLLLGSAGAALTGWFLLQGRAARATEQFAVTHTDEEWRRILSPEAYEVMRHEGTEAPESSPLDHEYGPGRYDCAGCALPLFLSTTKFDSGTGWPSFYAPIAHAVATKSDSSLFMERTEVHCSRCGGHLGHVFEDGPKPTGLRYCMNGVALNFHRTEAHS